MILADGLIVQWVAVSVAVSLLIKHIDHVAATWAATEGWSRAGAQRRVTVVMAVPQTDPVGADRVAEDIDSAGSSE
jgi:hypothetical protein